MIMKSTSIVLGFDFLDGKDNFWFAERLLLQPLSRKNWKKVYFEMRFDFAAFYVFMKQHLDFPLETDNLNWLLAKHDLVSSFGKFSACIRRRYDILEVFPHHAPSVILSFEVKK